MGSKIEHTIPNGDARKEVDLCLFADIAGRKHRRITIIASIATSRLDALILIVAI